MKAPVDEPVQAPVDKPVQAPVKAPVDAPMKTLETMASPPKKRPITNKRKSYEGGGEAEATVKKREKKKKKQGVPTTPAITSQLPNPSVAIPNALATALRTAQLALAQLQTVLDQSPFGAFSES